MNSPHEIHTFSELREHIHEALLHEHPEWIESNGQSPILDQYDARLEKLLATLSARAEHRPHQTQSAN
jgi:hypothetical protein